MDLAQLNDQSLEKLGWTWTTRGMATQIMKILNLISCVHELFSILCLEIVSNRIT